MELSNILSKESVIANVKASSKRQLLQFLANRAGEHIGVESSIIFQKLMEREQLGSTGLGNGIAIPHGKIENISSVYALFARVEKGVDFEAIDDRPVDLIIMLLAPIGAGADHLKSLARVARLLREKSVIEQLRQTNDRDKLYNILISHNHNSDAA